MAQEEAGKTEKLYYAIGEVADMLGEPLSTVRLWANEFSSVIRPRRNKKNNRLFTKSDIANLRNIQYLLRDSGLTHEGVKLRLANAKQAQTDTKTMEDTDVATKVEAVRRLQAVRDSLREILDYL